MNQAKIVIQRIEMISLQAKPATHTEPVKIDGWKFNSIASTEIKDDWMYVTMIYTKDQH